jgi:xanthine/uracil/vitamin C permease (AzgA family)
VSVLEMEMLFKLRERGTTVQTEILGGATTFINPRSSSTRTIL